MNLLLILFGKIVIFISKILNLGNGSTWPGHIALNINKNFIRDKLKNRKFKIILIAGTNGKTTTGKLIKDILGVANKRVFQNEAGANLINGVASAIIKNSSFLGKLNFDYAIFELDENTLPILLEFVSPDFIICLNLFRDQLDRYGEVNVILNKWEKSFKNLPNKTQLILNADDPQITFLGKNIKSSYYFGLNEKSHDKSLQHASDSIYCPLCNLRLNYETIYFSHLGNWRCENCGYKRPSIYLDKLEKYPLPGTYNKYNSLAAVLISRKLGVDDISIKEALERFVPAFGRQEKIIVNGRNFQIFLSKNPISFNQSLQTVAELKGKNIFLILNDRIPDGRDVSWIWDVDFEIFIGNFKKVFVSGDRAYDMALRLHYAIPSKFQIEPDLKKAIMIALEQTAKQEMLYILPTYSAMLDLRKILTGRSIL